MVRMKKIALAALVALALAAGSVAAAPQAQLAWSLGTSNPTGAVEPEAEQVAGSKGDMASAGRESS